MWLDRQYWDTLGLVLEGEYELQTKSFLCLFTGAFGYFEVTHDITRYCRAKVFEHVGKTTPIAIRFSTVGTFLYGYNVYNGVWTLYGSIVLLGLEMLS